MYFVYIIKNAKGKLYTGFTEDLENRLRCHNTSQGAIFTKYDGSFQVGFCEAYSTLKEASSRERQIKKWRREKKEFLIKRFQSGLETKMQDFS